MSSKLLPPNSTKLERTLADIVRKDLAIPIRELWIPDTCPAELLPYLAWALSVDHWEIDWSEDDRREVIKNSFVVHKHKGTISALRNVLLPFGYISKVIEWWQTDPPGTPGTFKIVLSTARSINEGLFRKMRQLIDNARPVSRHMDSIEIHLETEGEFFCGAASFGARISTTYPHVVSELISNGTLYSGAICTTHEKITIYPQKVS